jgi:phage terminase small subunit
MAGNANSGGRNAKSPAEHRAAGTYQPVRHAGYETPAPPKGRPEPPIKLSAVARAEWHRMILRMEHAKTSSIVDDAVLLEYVELFEETRGMKKERREWERLKKLYQRELRETEKTSTLEANRRGDILDRMHTIQKTIDGFTGRLRLQHLALTRMLLEFGMTPAARTRVKIPSAAEQPEDDDDRFFGSGSVQ